MRQAEGDFDAGEQVIDGEIDQADYVEVEEAVILQIGTAETDEIGPDGDLAGGEALDCSVGEGQVG